jgi:hypothetical protein
MISRLPFIRCFSFDDCRCLGSLEELHERLDQLCEEPRPIEEVDRLGVRIYLVLCCMSKQCPLAKERKDATEELRKPTYDRWRDQ